MDFFDVLTLVGGVSLFLFGMKIMGQSLERRAGNSLRSILARLTDNPFAGFLTGLAVTAVIQSSSATSVMVIGFVNSGLMTLSQAMNVIMGANVGTTITAWIMSLNGINGTNLFLRLLQPSSFTPVLAFIGVLLLIGSKGDKKKESGMILLGFATLMFGLSTMSSAVSGLRSVPAFQDLLIKFENPVLGLAVGAVLTAIVQSSSASVGILQSLSMTGAVTYGAAIPLIMGQNIGASVPVLISSIGANRDARRASLFYLVFNMVGAVFWLAVFWIIKSLVSIGFLSSASNPFGIAMVHTSFKLLCCVLEFPMRHLMERLVRRIIPDGGSVEKKVELDERLLATPAIALDRCRNIMDEMAKEANDGIDLSLDILFSWSDEFATVIEDKESLTDHYEDIVGTYLVKLSGANISQEESMVAAEYLKLLSDFERISDHSVKILGSAREMKEKRISFTETGTEELAILIKAIRHITLLSYNAFVNHDMDSAYKVEPLEQVVDYLKEELKMRHIRRLQKGECSIEAGFVLNDILTSLERVSDHCSNIAGCIIDAVNHNLNLHETLNDYKYHSERFDSSYSEFRKQYALPAHK